MNVMLKTLIVVNGVEREKDKKTVVMTTYKDICMDMEMLAYLKVVRIMRIWKERYKNLLEEIQRRRIM